MTFNKARYLSGYSVGVGGVVLHEGRILLVRLALGHGAGTWAIPGGFVEPDEMLDAAILRELREETSVAATVVGMLGVRGRVTPGENSVYVIFLLHAESDAAQPDGFEVDEARFFVLDDALTLLGLNALSRLVIAHVKESNVRALMAHPHPDFPTSEYLMYL